MSQTKQPETQKIMSLKYGTFATSVTHYEGFLLKNVVNKYFIGKSGKVQRRAARALCLVLLIKHEDYAPSIQCEVIAFL